MTIVANGDVVSSSANHLVFAYYVTGHGFGHATRVVEVFFFQLRDFLLRLKILSLVLLILEFGFFQFFSYSQIAVLCVCVFKVVRHLINAGHDVHVVTGAPEYVFTTAVQSPRLFIRKVYPFQHIIRI